MRIRGRQRLEGEREYEDSQGFILFAKLHPKLNTKTADLLL